IPVNLNMNGREDELLISSRYCSRSLIVRIRFGKFCCFQFAMLAYPKKGALILYVSSTFISVSDTTVDLYDFPSTIRISPIKYSTGPSPNRWFLFAIVSRFIFPSSSPFHITFFIAPTMVKSFLNVCDFDSQPQASKRMSVINVSIFILMGFQLKIRVFDNEAQRVATRRTCVQYACVLSAR